MDMLSCSRCGLSVQTLLSIILLSSHIAVIHSQIVEDVNIPEPPAPNQLMEQCESEHYQNHVLTKSMYSCGAIMCHPLLCWILKVIFVHSFVHSYILNFPTSESTMSCLTKFSVNQGIRIYMEVGGMIFDGSQYHFQWYWVTRQDLRFVYLIESIYHGKRCMNYHKFWSCSVIEFGWLAALFFNWQCLKQ